MNTLVSVGSSEWAMELWRSNQEVDATAERWAVQNGWGVSRNAFLPFELGGPDDGQGQATILLHTTANGRPVAVADYSYRKWHNSWNSSAQETRQMIRRTVTTVRLPQPHPRMTVKHRGNGGPLGGKFGKFLGGVGAMLDPVNAALGELQEKWLGPKLVDVSLGYPPFDDQFEIQATDPDSARRLLGPTLVNELVAGQGPTWSIQGANLYTVTGSSPLVPEEIPARLSSLLRVADLLGR